MPPQKSSNLLIVCLIASVPSLAQSSEADAAKPWFFVVPERIPHQTTPPAIRELPANARQIPALTLNATVRRQAGHGKPIIAKKTFVRTVDRVHVSAGGDREWLFVRNPVDARRVSGSVVDHKTRTIVTYEESELRNAMNIGNWIDALTLGFDIDVLKRLKPTGRSRKEAGIRFEQYAADAADRNVTIREVWWSEEQLLASSYTVRVGGDTTRFSITRVAREASADLLRNPADRFRNYKVIDYADWLESH